MPDFQKGLNIGLQVRPPAIRRPLVQLGLAFGPGNIEAGGKRATRSGQNDDFHLIVVLNRVKGRPQLNHHLPCERIELRRAIQGQIADTISFLKEEIFTAHAPYCLHLGPAEYNGQQSSLTDVDLMA